MFNLISILLILFFCLAQENDVVKVKPIYTLAETGYILDINMTYSSMELIKKTLIKSQ